MKLLVLNEHEVTELLTMEECIVAMEDALSALARGEVHNPLRQAIRAPGAAGLLGLMPAWRAGATPYYALKEVCVFPENPKRGLDTHLGAVILHSGETGELLAIMNAAAITAIRTAAVSAVATKLLAREDATVLAILGTGVQAKSHLRAIPLVRSISEVRVYSRNVAAGPVAQFPGAARWSEPQRVGSGPRTAPPGNRETGPAATLVVASAEEAVRGADIIVTATSSREPVLKREWISAGAHINAVGSSIAAARELDGATVAAASLFVDRRESTVNESGDYLFALREGAIAGPEHIRAELGEILTGAARGRTSREEITLFKSLGLAVEDLASAALLYEKARREGRGKWVEF
ncbi:MAG TPA: ornithine cyclodeaminase family protein [Thermoanaerobaculia bacterium]|nr:ornithine cyclodeaminase family protein [Thermoanaerobaculia bacterium]